MEKLIRSYNAAFMSLFNLLHSKKKKDADIEKLKVVLMSVKNHIPNQIIELSGPHLWRYREEIYANKIEFFLTKDFNEELKNVKEDIDHAKRVIQVIKDLWGASNAQEQAFVKEKVREMLVIYANYLNCSRASLCS